MRWASCSSRWSPASDRSRARAVLAGPRLARSHRPAAVALRARGVARRSTALVSRLLAVGSGAASAARSGRRRRTAPAAGAAGAAAAVDAVARLAAAGALVLRSRRVGLWALAPGAARRATTPVIAVLPLENATGDERQRLPRGRRRRQPGHQPGVAADGHRAVARRGRRVARPPVQSRPTSPATSARPSSSTAPSSAPARSCGWRSACCVRTARWPGPKRWKARPTACSRCRPAWPARWATRCSVQMSAADRARLEYAADLERQCARRLLARPRAARTA